MFELKAILVATDFSESSDAALAKGCAFAAAFGASLHVLHVAGVRDLERDAARQLEQLPALVAFGRDRAVLSTASGDPIDEIIKYAHDFDIRLIVCGTHGRRGWDRVLMGSVAERVVRLAPCPVLTVPPVQTVRELNDDVRCVQRPATERLLAS